MADDFKSFAAQKQYADLESERAQAIADLQREEAEGDLESAKGTVQRIANISAAQQNLVNLHNQYEASQRPPEQESPEERQAKPLNRMNADDGLDIARTSRYGRNLSWSDPDVQAGYREAMRRRARGEP